jgi:hypothetical protein
MRNQPKGLSSIAILETHSSQPPVCLEPRAGRELYSLHHPEKSVCSFLRIMGMLPFAKISQSLPL